MADVKAPAPEILPWHRELRKLHCSKPVGPWAQVFPGKILKIQL